MKKLFRLGFVVLGLAAALPLGVRAATAATPVPRTDANSRQAHEDLLAKARQGGIDVYFIGDSIVRRWGTSDAQYRPLLDNWNANFHGWNAANFGWGADRLEHILWRLENGELEGVNPKVIVILAGTNNLDRNGTSDTAVGDITEGMRAILAVCRGKAPRATVLLTAIFPRNDFATAVPAINKINARFAGLADGRTVRFIDVSAQFAGSDGKLFPGMTVDNLHPSVKGYQAWADALKPHLTELLGPPAATDRAPLPTGDPSARAK